MENINVSGDIYKVKICILVFYHFCFTALWSGTYAICWVCLRKNSRKATNVELPEERELARRKKDHPLTKLKRLKRLKS